MEHGHTGLRRLAVGLVAGFAIGGSLIETARAQTGTPTATSAESLPEIIVTAQKTAQTVESVPVSVTSLDGELAQQTGATGFADLQNYAANVVLSLTPTTSDIYIRGFGTPSTNAGFEPSVGSVVDGVFYGRSTFLSAFFYDLDRIEVLRGPQGTLFGKNSTAGLINVSTRAPDAEFGASTEVFYADTDTRIVRPAINLALGPSLSARISGSYSDAEGMLYNTALDRHELGVDQRSTRLRLRYAPDQNWSFELGAFHSNQRLNNNPFQLSRVSAPMLEVIRHYDPDAEDRADNFRNSANVPAVGKATFDGVNATVNADFDAALGMETLTLTSVTAWARDVTQARDLDADFSGAPVIRDSLTQPSPFSQRSQELRISGRGNALFSLGDHVDFVAGVHYYDTQLSANDLFALEDLGAALAYLTAAQAGQTEGNGLGQLLGGAATRLAIPLSDLITLLDPALTPVLGGPQSAFVSLDQHGRSYALFGQLEQQFTEQWSLIAGLRLGRESKHGAFASQANGVLIPLIADQQDHNTRIDRSEDEFSPKLGLRWAFAEHASTYLTWSRGYKSGGFNALPLNPDHLEFEPERASSWELGAKSRLLQGSMRVSAAVFDTHFDDLQVSTFQGASYVILNAAAARSRGFETDISWLTPLPGAALHGSIGYVDAQYTHYPNAPAPADAAEPSQDLRGERLAIAPRWTVGLVPSYTTLLTWPQTTATLALDLFYRSDRYLDVDLDQRTYQPATTEINGRITLAAQTGRWLLNLAARNLTGEVVLEQVLDQPLAAGNFAATRSDQGRVLSANLVLSF